MMPFYFKFFHPDAVPNLESVQTKNPLHFCRCLAQEPELLRKLTSLEIREERGKNEVVHLSRPNWALKSLTVVNKSESITVQSINGAGNSGKCHGIIFYITKPGKFVGDP